MTHPFTVNHISETICSGIYRGYVYHNRYLPLKHRFSYSLFMLYLNLAEVDNIFRGRLFWSNTRYTYATFRREDHLGDPETPLDEAVRELVAKETGKRPQGPICLLTHPRYFGYVMNPLSIYYCFSDDGTCVEYAVLEVHNTPWGEMYPYIIQNYDMECDRICSVFPKKFHVSPFMEMDHVYELKLNRPGQELQVELKNIKDGVCLFDAALKMKKFPITTGQLARAALRHPFMTGKVIVAIYYEALRLWWKGAIYYPYVSRQERLR